MRLVDRVRQAEDPTVAVLLLTLLMVAVGLLAWSIAAHDKDIREGGLAVLGGALLMLTVYFTARNLQISARSAFEERLLQASEFLSDGDPVKRVAGEKALLHMRQRARKASDQEAIDAVLTAAQPKNRT
jgi:hypothetical protein